MKRSKFAISRDKDIKAQKPGKRAANKNRETYYEYRENRTDSDLRKKLEWGGTAESSETGVPVGGENQSSMYKTGGGVGKYEKLVKDNWDEITYSYETGGSKLPKTISNGDAEGFLEEFDNSFSNMSEEEQSNAIKKFKNAFKSLRITKMQTGGGAGSENNEVDEEMHSCSSCDADVPLSETDNYGRCERCQEEDEEDEEDYARGGEITESKWVYPIGGL
jgi:hypothetical protein